MKDESIVVDGGIIRKPYELAEKVSELSRSENIGQIYLRGQSDSSWGLIPTVGRKHYFNGNMRKFNNQIEFKLLHRFRRRAYAHYNRILSEWEALFLARHHGLPVRLLDWTANPLVALFNACTFEQKAETDGAVWAFLREEHLEQDASIDVLTEQISPLQVKGVKIIYPFDASPRMVVQAGIFTIQEDPQKGLEEYNPKDFNKRDFDMQKLIKWIIPKESKSNFIEYLDRNAIHRRALFPDLDGLSRGLWETDVLRYGSPVEG